MKTSVQSCTHETRKQGILASPKIIICKLFNIWENRVPWPVKVRFWYHLMRLIFILNYKKKRILGIWDYKALPWSVGDPISMLLLLAVVMPPPKLRLPPPAPAGGRENPGGNR